MATPPIDDDESVDALFESVGKKLGWFDDDALRKLTAKSTQKKKVNMSKHREPSGTIQKGKSSKSVGKPQRNSSHTSYYEHDPLVVQQPVPSGARVPLKELNAGSIAGITPDCDRVPSPTDRPSLSAVVCSPRKLSFSGCDSHSGDGLSGGILLQGQQRQQPDLSAPAAASISCRLAAAAAAVECSASPPPRSVVSAGTPSGDCASIPIALLTFSNCSRESSTPSSTGTSPKQAIVRATAATSTAGCLFAHSESPECDRLHTISNSSSSGIATSLPLVDCAAASPLLQVPAASANNVQAVGLSCLGMSFGPLLDGRPLLSMPDGGQGFDVSHVAACDKTCVDVTDASVETAAVEQNTTASSRNSQKSDDAASSSVCGRSTLFSGCRCSEPCHTDVPVVEEFEDVLFGSHSPAVNFANTDGALSHRDQTSVPASLRATAGDVLSVIASKGMLDSDGSHNCHNDGEVMATSGSSSVPAVLVNEELLPGKESDESVDELFQNIGEKLGWFNDDKLLQLSQKASSTKKVKTKAVSNLRLPKKDESIDFTEGHHKSKFRSADDKQLQLIRKERGHKKVVPGASECASHSKVPLSKRGDIPDKTPKHRQSIRTTVSSDDDEDDKFEAFLAAVRTPSVAPERTLTTDGGTRRSIDDFVVDNDEVEYDSSASSLSLPSPGMNFYSTVNRIIDTSEKKDEDAERWQHRQRATSSSESETSGGGSQDDSFDTLSDDSSLSDDDRGNTAGPPRRPPPTPAMRLASAVRATPAQDSASVPNHSAKHHHIDDGSQDESFDILSDDSSLSDDDRGNTADPPRRQPPTPAARLATAVRATPARDSASMPKRTCSFLKSLDADLPEGVARDPSTVKYLTNFRKNRDDLATRLHKLYNETVFDGKLTDVPVIWNKKMLKTAGFCYYTTTTDQHRSARIELATKVVDRAERLRDTLLHEMCHAATWVVYQHRQGHGTLWQMWGRLACSVHPDLQVVSRCHSYAITKKYTYRCSKCSQVYGRHSKSIDVERHRCGVCKGVLELIVQDGRRAAAAASSGTPLRTPKTPGRFALFVKENYGKVKACGDVKRTHGEVMRALAEAFSQLPSGMA